MEIGGVCVIDCASGVVHSTTFDINVMVSILHIVWINFNPRIESLYIVENVHCTVFELHAS